jgi:hypothetical protein
MGDVEVMYAAGKQVKDMAESGELRKLHDRVDSTQETAISQYASAKSNL